MTTPPSTTIMILGLSGHSLPLNALHIFEYEEKKTITEIQRHDGATYVTFQHPSDASNAALSYNDHVYCFHLPRKLTVSLLPPGQQIPTGGEKLSDFLAARGEKMHTCTVLVKGVPDRHGVRFVRSMVSEIFVVEENEWEYDEEDVDPYVAPRVRVTGSTALVRFKRLGDAERFVEGMDGLFWKTRVVFCECVGDVEV